METTGQHVIEIENKAEAFERDTDDSDHYVDARKYFSRGERNGILFLSLLEKQQEEDLPSFISEQLYEAIECMFRDDYYEIFEDVMHIIEEDNVDVQYIDAFKGDERLSGEGRWILSILRTEKLPKKVCRAMADAIAIAADCFLTNCWNAIDSEEKGKTMIRLFPTLVPIFTGITDSPLILQSRPKEDISLTIKSMSLIPLTVEHLIQLNQFERDERGGLLLQPLSDKVLYTVLRNLCLCHSEQFNYESDDDRRVVEETALKVMVVLREIKLFQKYHIKEGRLIEAILYGEVVPFHLHRKERVHRFVPEKIFQFLTDWDPTVLMTSLSNHNSMQLLLPIHHSIRIEPSCNFLMVLKAGMRHFPRKLGFIFDERIDFKFDQDEMDNLEMWDENYINLADAENAFEHSRTYEIPYFIACEKYGNDFMERGILDQMIGKCPEIKSCVRILLLAADEDIDLSISFRLLRRDPSKWSKQLLGECRNSSSRKKVSGKNNYDNGAAQPNPFVEENSNKTRT
eukprot:jgi/Psemu1/285559/fgenesh1_pg.93_\